MLRRNKPAQLQRSTDGSTAAGARGQSRSSGTRTGLVTQTAVQRPAEASTREPFTYVHRGTVIIGEVSGTGRVRVHGEVRGDVRIDGVLEVAESGSVEGDVIEAREVKVLGRVEADVVASGKVEIWKGGVLVGDVTAPALDIEEGATFNGFSHMTDGAGEGTRGPGRSAAELGAADSAGTGEVDDDPRRLSNADETGQLDTVEGA